MEGYADFLKYSITWIHNKYIARNEEVGSMLFYSYKTEDLRIDKTLCSHKNLIIRFIHPDPSYLIS